ncbi:MAG TPA: hypothetical protein VHC97_03505 [Thermoanaerobaculia bacterium]|jgi:hypothetical protein|nr:hypothetical protein [Thermoanaerobaculia bacterium]
MNATRVKIHPDEEPEEEFQRIREIILDLSARMDRSERKVDFHLRNIDRTLRELDAQKEQIRILERGLGIQRQG